MNFLYGGFGTSMVLVSVTGKRTRNDGDGYRVGTTQRTFDPNGNVRSQSGTSDFTMRYFIYNPEGRIVLKMSFGEHNPMHDLLSVNGKVSTSITSVWKCSPRSHRPKIVPIDFGVGKQVLTIEI